MVIKSAAEVISADAAVNSHFLLEQEKSTRSTLSLSLSFSLSLFVPLSKNEWWESKLKGALKVNSKSFKERERESENVRTKEVVKEKERDTERKR